MSVITATTGRETFATGSSTLGVFVMENTPGYAGKHIGLVAKDFHSNVASVGAPTKASAGTGLRADIVGEWTTGSYDVMDGQILRVSGTRQSSTFGTMRNAANILIRPRGGAAYRRITMGLTNAPKASKSEVVIEGRFDLVTVEEAEKVGVKITPAIRAFCSDTMIRRLFTVTELEPELVGKAVHEEREVLVDGEVKKVTIARKKRALQF